MIRSLRDDGVGSTVGADVCVVGAGAGGIALALALVDAGRSVVLLESGGFEPEPDTQQLYGGDVVGEPFGDLDPASALAEVRLRRLGGTTNHWAGFCRPLDPLDFEVQDRPGPSGWPFGRDELDPWYREAGELLGLPGDAFDWSDWTGATGLDDPLADTDLVRTGAYQVRPVRFGEAFRADLESAPDLDLVLHANLVGLTFAGDTVTAAEAVTLDGDELTVEASSFVLALGGIENARMLLHLDRGDGSSGVGNENDLVGRYFCEHPQAIMGVATVAADPDLLRSVFESGAPVGDGPEPVPVVRGVLVASEDAARERGLRSFGVQALAGAIDTDAPVAVRGLDGRDIAVYDELSQGIATPGVLYLLVTGEQLLHADSRVLLGDEPDALGIPRAVVDWQLTVEDRATMLDALRLLGRELGRLGLGRVQLAPGNLVRAEEGGFEVDPDDADPEGFQPGIGFHHLCTTRMAADPARGVVDADLRVHTVDNLYVLGSSSFATAGSAPPTLTIVALALRLAETLAAGP